MSAHPPQRESTVTAESDAFEQLNQRIAQLLQDADATVEWNAHIPDPDSPGDSRQIDVLIIDATGKRTSVECRERGGAQSVMWIEELVGRKLSLDLDGMIAVSLKGFSALARTKAARYGIVLYDFDRLSDVEIASWGGVVRVESVFVQFTMLEIVAGIATGSETRLNPDPNGTVFIRGVQDGFAAVQDALRDDTAAHPNLTRTCELDPSGYTIDGLPLTLLRCGYAGHLVTQTASCIYAALVDAPGTARPLRSTEVQRFEHSVHEVLQYAGESHLQIDVSKVRPPGNAILHETQIVFPQPTRVTRYELIGDRRMLSVADLVALNVVTTL